MKNQNLKRAKYLSTGFVIAMLSGATMAEEAGQEQSQEYLEPQTTIVKVPVEAIKVKEKIVYSTNSPFEFINEIAKENGFKVYWKSSFDEQKLQGDLKGAGILNSADIWLDRIISTVNLVNHTEKLSETIGNTLKVGLCDKNRLVIYNYNFPKTDKKLKGAFCHTVENKESVKFYLEGKEVDIKQPLPAEMVEEVEKQKQETLNKAE